MTRPLYTVDPFCKSHKPEDRPLPPEEKRRCGVEDRSHVERKVRFDSNVEKVKENYPGVTFQRDAWGNLTGLVWLPA